MPVYDSSLGDLSYPAVAARVGIGACAYNTNAATAAGTLTAANISGGNDSVVLALTGTFAGVANMQLPTVASVVAAVPLLQVGQSYIMRVINVAAGFTLTITTNTGWTISGTAATIATATWREFIVTITALGATPTATLVDIGGASIV